MRNIHRIMNPTSSTPSGESRDECQQQEVQGFSSHGKENPKRQVPLCSDLLRKPPKRRVKKFK